MIQIYAIRQALAKAIVAFYQKFVDEASKTKIKDTLMAYDRWVPAAYDINIRVLLYLYEACREGIGITMKPP